MDDRTIIFAVSESEKAIIDAEIASGRYDDDGAVLRAGLTALKLNRRLAELRAVIAEGEAEVAVELYGDHGAAVHMLDDLDDDAPGLQQRLTASEASGLGSRRIPEIMADVKAKLRGHGQL